MTAERDEVSCLLAGQVRELIRLVNETDIAELRIEQGDLKLHIVKGHEKGALAADAADTPEPATSEEPAKEEEFIVALMVGRFYRSAPGKPPLVQCGDTLQKGQKICVVESLKVMNDVVSDFEGEVEEILCEDGQAVEYGQPLFRVRLSQI